MATYSDDFNRADAATLGANWTNRFGSMGIEGNMAVPFLGNTYCTSTFNTTMTTNDMEVAITVGSIVGSPGGAWVVLGANTSGESALAWWDESNAFNIYSMTGWDFGTDSTLRDTAVATFNVADTFGLGRVGNVYTGLKNGVAISGSSWTDSGNVVPRDASHRLTGCGSHATTSFLDYRRINAWSATTSDFAKPRSLFVCQSVKRSYFY